MARRFPLEVRVRNMQWQDVSASSFEEIVRLHANAASPFKLNLLQPTDLQAKRKTTQ